MEINPRLIEVCQTLINYLDFIKDIRVWNLDRTPTITLAVNLLQAKHRIESSARILQSAEIKLGIPLTATLESILRGSGRHFTTVQDFIEACKELIAEGISVSRDNFILTIQPVFGSPWNFKDEVLSYFSIKKRKMIQSQPPPMIIPELDYYDTDHGKHVRLPVLDWCKVIPRLQQRGDYISLFADNFQYFVSHCFSDLNGIKKAIKDCEGLLFPSISAGLIPSNNFGPYTLIFDPQVVLAGLKPYRTTKGEYPVHVYKTDAWTINTSGFFGSKGRQALLEWTGNSEGRLDIDFDLLLDWDLQEEEPLRNTKQFLIRLKKIKAIWNDPTKQVENVIFSSAHENNYPYLEAKVNGILPLSACSIALAPKEDVSKLRTILRKGGFQGKVIGINWKKEDIFTATERRPTPEWSKQDQWNYGWQIRNILLKELKAHPGLAHSMLLPNPAENVGGREFFHGSNEPITEFGEPEKWIAFDGLETLAPIWLTSDKKFAGYGHKYTTTVVYDPSDKKIFPESESLFEKVGYYYELTELGKRILEAIKQKVLFPNCPPENWEEVLKNIDNLDYDILETKSFMDWLKNQQYDGFWVRGDGPTNLAIFDPTEIEVINTELSRS